MNRHLILALTCGIALPLALVACSSPSTTDRAPHAHAAPADDSPGHGEITGATEEAEPQLKLLTVDDTGAVGLLDLLDGGERALDPIPVPVRLSTDGRYVFGDSGAGLSVTDSGAWTWDHGDHFHFYSAEPSQLGIVPGDGAARVTGGPLSTAGATGVFFAGSGEAVLLDNTALATGTLTERFRVAVTPHSGILAPIGDGAVVSEALAGSDGTQLRVLDDAGGASDTTAPCDAPRGATSTRAGLVVLCAGGAVDGTDDDGLVSLSPAPLPNGAGAAPAALDGRKGRPTLAGPGVTADGEHGVWLFEVRARAWTWIPSSAPLAAAAAVGDDAGHIVAVDTAGRVVVFRGSDEVAATAPLLTGEDLTDAGLERVSLTVDANRTYLNAPASGVVYEIDVADGARIARELQPAVAPVFVAEVGR